MLQPASQSEKRRRERVRELRRRRIRRSGRRAYVRSVQFLPSLATLGNALCGFAAIYVVTLDEATVGPDRLAQYLVQSRFLAAVYLVALAMIFDALDGRLARIARHTTDFGGQLDSLADAISFGAAPAFIALHVLKFDDLAQHMSLPLEVTRLFWAIAALYVACALLRLARFNVSNEHGEQHHMSFLGLPTPAAAGAVLGVVLMQQDLLIQGANRPDGPVRDAMWIAAGVLTILLPVVLLSTALLMVSNFRYPHTVNRLLRGRRPFWTLVLALGLILLLVVQHRYVLGVTGLVIAFSGPAAWLLSRARTTASEKLEAPTKIEQ